VKLFLLILASAVVLAAEPPPDDFGLQLVKVISIPYRGPPPKFDRYAIFRCTKREQPGEKGIPDFPKRTGETFTLPPGSANIFKVLSIEKEQVVIEYPDGSRKTLSLPR
jgi:hypothetical protein